MSVGWECERFEVPVASLMVFVAWITDARVSQSLDKLGMTTRAMSRGEYRRYVANEIERWKGYVKAAGIQPE